MVSSSRKLKKENFASFMSHVKNKIERDSDISIYPNL